MGLVDKPGFVIASGSEKSAKQFILITQKKLYRLLRRFASRSDAKFLLRQQALWDSPFFIINIPHTPLSRFSTCIPEWRLPPPFACFRPGLEIFLPQPVPFDNSKLFFEFYGWFLTDFQEHFPRFVRITRDESKKNYTHGKFFFVSMNDFPVIFIESQDNPFFLSRYLHYLNIGDSPVYFFYRLNIDPVPAEENYRSEGNIFICKEFHHSTVYRKRLRSAYIRV